MNILYIMAGSDRSGNRDQNYPLPLVEVNGVPLIELQINKSSKVGGKIIFALKSDDARKHGLSSIINLLHPSAEIFQVSHETKGAACTALLASSAIDNDAPLLILGMDDYHRVDFAKIISDFQSRNLDAGTAVFNSVHPRYSYVKLDSKNQIVEASEKKPISRHATSGFYYFKHGHLFVEAAKNMIRKDASVSGVFYICPTFNELILMNKKLGIYQLEKHEYLPIKSEVQLSHFLKSMEGGDGNENRFIR